MYNSLHSNLHRSRCRDSNRRITGRHNRRCRRNSRTRIRSREPIPRTDKADSSRITGSKCRLITLNGRRRTSTSNIRHRMNRLTGRRITRNTWTSRQT